MAILLPLMFKVPWAISLILALMSLFQSLKSFILSLISSKLTLSFLKSGGTKLDMNWVIYFTFL